MLPELLDLVANDTLQRLADTEPLLGCAELGEERFGRCGLHLDPHCHALDVDVGIVVDRQTAGESLPELDRAEGGGKGEEFGDVSEVAEGLGVSG